MTIVKWIELFSHFKCAFLWRLSVKMRKSLLGQIIYKVFYMNTVLNKIKVQDVWGLSIDLSTEEHSFCLHLSLAVSFSYIQYSVAFAFPINSLSIVHFSCTCFFSTGSLIEETFKINWWLFCFYFRSVSESADDLHCSWQLKIGRNISEPNSTLYSTLWQKCDLLLFTCWCCIGAESKACICV